MALPLLMIVLGLVILVWSADVFVEGSAALAGYWGVPSLLIGMLVIGFGTSAPELCVSALSSWQGNSGIAIGNAYGSNITNIALILGSVALIKPISVHSQIIRNELPILTMVTVFVVLQLFDGELSRLDAIVDLVIFVVVILWMIRQAKQQPAEADILEREMVAELKEHTRFCSRPLISVLGGVTFLLLSSRMLVWGAVSVATQLGVSDLVIGLTIVAIGTSLPELASSVIAARKGEDDLALGNIIGSNLFNSLAVVGLAGTIRPMQIPEEIVLRDWPLMAVLTVLLFAFGYSRKADGIGKITRLEGGALLVAYLAYTLYLVKPIVGL